MLKYEFTDETKIYSGITLHRIKALVDFGCINAGEIGGWIETEDNLSQYGDSWVSGDARVYGNAQVYGDAQVYGNAQVYGDARISGDARVYGNAQVYVYAQVYGNAQVYGDARISGNAQVYGNAYISGDAWVSGYAFIYGDAWVSDDACISGNAHISGDARVCGDAWVYGKKCVFWISAIGSRNGTTTFFNCEDGKIRVLCGCFYGDLDEFLEAVNKTHGDNEYGQVYRLAIEMAKKRIHTVREEVKND